MTNEQLREWLTTPPHKACDEALQWLGTRDEETAWFECVQPNWLLWYAAKRGWGVWPAYQRTAIRIALNLEGNADVAWHKWAQEYLDGRNRSVGRARHVALYGIHRQDDDPASEATMARIDAAWAASTETILQMCDEASRSVAWAVCAIDHDIDQLREREYALWVACEIVREEIAYQGE